jgi:aldehyde:ferredoxin oxidoreductase
MLGQITGSGAGWPGSGFDMRSGAPDLGYPKATDRATQKGKAEELFAHTNGRNFWENVGVCWFGTADNAEGMFKDAVDALSATTGWKGLTLEDCLASGERSWQLERIFNIEHGLKPEDDYQNIGPRFLEAVPDGQYKGFTIAKWLPGLVFDFYRACGWDERTGKPYRDTLRRLGIEEYAI